MTERKRVAVWRSWGRRLVGGQPEAMTGTPETPVSEQVHVTSSPIGDVDLLQTLATARLLMTAIRELHHEEQWHDGTEVGRGVVLMEPHCTACLRPYPCPTVALIDQAGF